MLPSRATRTKDRSQAHATALLSMCHPVMPKDSLGQWLYFWVCQMRPPSGFEVQWEDVWYELDRTPYAYGIFILLLGNKRRTHRKTPKFQCRILITD